MAYLRRQFSGRVISNKAVPWGEDWSARSPDMNPLDFGVWGVLKARVFERLPRDMQDLRQKITTEVNKLNNEPDLLRFDNKITLSSRFKLK